MGFSSEDKKILATAMKYTDETVKGGGAIKGKNCTVDSIKPISGGQRVTFKWTLDDGTEQTTTMDVMNGVDGQDGQDGQDGKGIKSVAVNEESHLIITYTDDTTYDAGAIEVHSAVDSVNGKTGEVTLDASDVGALPSDTAIPSKTSDLTNDSNFVADANYVHTDNNYDATAKDVVDGVTTALSGKVDKETGKSLIDLTTVVDGASYDSTNHLILFKNGTTTLFSLDAAAFVKDGMVDTVTITGGNLVITFNTDAGKQAISIPITDIFDPANYYDKTATDNLLADKTDKVSGATNGNFAGLDANGNLTDSGSKASDFIPVIGKMFTASHGRYVCIGTLPISSGVVNSVCLLINILAAELGSYERPNRTAIINISTGADSTAFNISGFTDIKLSSSYNNSARFIVTKDTTTNKYYVYVDSEYKYLFIRYQVLSQTDFTSVAFEDSSSVVGTEIYNSQTDTTGKIVYLPSLNGKADKVTSATAGNLASLDVNGNLADSGKKASDFVSAANLDALNQIAAGIYEGTDLTVKFADEIANYTDEWAWVQARLDTHDVSGMLPGDYIPIVVGTETHQAQIAGINPYFDTCDSGYEVKYHIDWITRDCYGGATVKWNNSDNNNGSAAEASPFLASNLNSWLNSTLYGLLEAKLKAVIKEKRILAPTRYQSGQSLTDDNSWAWKTTGKLWVPYETEIFDNVQWSTKGFGESQNVQYEIFRNSYRARRKKQGPTGARANWWTASAYSGNATYAVYVSGYGTSGNNSASDSFYAPVCFRTMATT